ncbi:aldehyde oxidase and xanthine dehydrogenase molybdopterin binding protein (plasmid) [Haloterrigena turkmenica DSM 5511]|uniref:Aldehyde oxidase and xanthine dehydrogenase molybdopterin binding protein n=1 Tax=Haloterrigena turkmenica (strain ATCC 51198 / DSM 5511 / JCM 9101 / NCIMB 13204 / VKM B-1734 / 4k) TaxID=543526 RepID=D2S098_HALTV|nr:molybdopterin cofactor-binding domain-containing protein [Haloterrigena turkmenica]ADB62795.1 aldehyde oxidase and xanthine dehydrogenase molybdopterin binding protein [Haloterrigena turkmenica DSM 5511]
MSNLEETQGRNDRPDGVRAEEVASETDASPGEDEVAEDDRKPREEREHLTENVEKDDARKIVTGEARYTADYRDRFPELAEGKVIRSDIAHGYVRDIDVSEAEAMDGVYAVITPWDDVVPDKAYSSSGQSYPEPSPWDLRVLREHVRYVGDPVAAIAAKDAETADRAARTIDVEYEEREPVLDPEEAMEPDAPQLFDPAEVENKQRGADYERNLESHFEGERGDVERAFERADDDRVIETEWETPYQSHCVPEPHTTIVHTDEDDRYSFITATQVPFHTRRQIAHLFDVPIRDVRVTKPRIGAGFGAKQEMAIEPIAFALHLAADKPVKLEMTRREEFYALRFRHPMRMRMRTAVDDDGTIEAMDLYALSNSGAYGTHGMTVANNVGTKPLPLYPRVPNVRFEGDVVHTNLPMGAAMRGYGAPQGHFAVEAHMDEVARRLDLDPIEFRERNAVREGDVDRNVAILKDDEKFTREIRSCGLRECIERGKEAIGYDDLDRPEEAHRSRGVGVALIAQGSGVAGRELGAAQIKMNEDGSFHLQVGGVDTGTGSDTMFSQVAAEVLGCEPTDIVVISSDTDLTPFDYGAYASSTTYISGQAVKEAAEDARERLVHWGSKMLDEPVENLRTGDGEVYSEVTDESVSLEEIGYEATYGHDDREHILGKGNHSTDESPPPYGAQFVDVTVNEETGEYDINKMVFAADCGVAINPALVEGQIEGGEHMSLEFATSGGLTFDEEGNPEVLGFRQYGMPRTTDHPPMETIIVETHEPTGPFGAKSIAELPTNGVPPALSNAVRDAVGVRVNSLPITADDIKRALEERDG